MKTVIKQLNLIFTLIILLAIGQIQAQELVKLNLLPDSKLWFDGTSTLHDFTCESKTIDAKLQAKPNGSSMVEKPEFDLEVVVPVKSLESGKDAMDDNMFEALKEEDHPEIIYSLKSIKSKEAPDLGHGWYQLESIGELKIAGIKKTIQMIVDAFESDDGTVQIKGSTPVDMTEYKVDPPSFMFGTIETGKDVVIHFDLKFKKS